MRREGSSTSFDDVARRGFRGRPIDVGKDDTGTFRREGPYIVSPDPFRAARDNRNPVC